MSRNRGSRLFSSYAKLLVELPKIETILPKFQFKNSSTTIHQLKGLTYNDSVVLNGWIDKKPKKISKNLIFCTLRDTNGDAIQLVDTKRLLKNASLEDVVQIEGRIKQKLNKDNSIDERDQYEIEVESLKTLNKSNEKPSQLQDLKLDGNYPQEYRYLQLRLPKFHNYLKKRYDILTNIRQYLDEKKFMEVATPVLFKSTPEGAREFLVPTRRRNNENNSALFYALPQSPQQYKQLLMASGIHNYFQIAKCFRDEDLRADRQPEFTQVDLEMAFAKKNDIMETVEKLVKRAWNTFSFQKSLLTIDDLGKLVPVNEKQNLNRLTYERCMREYGIDKPDLRLPKLKITDLTEFNAHGIRNTDFPVFEILVIRGGFRTKQDFEKRWSYLQNDSNYNNRTPIIVPIEDNELASNWHEKFLEIASFENPTIINKYLNLRKGDIICGSTREPNNAIFENPTPLGRLRQLIMENKEASSFLGASKIDTAIWVVDFPLFSPIEIPNKPNHKTEYPIYERNKFTSTHHPFTMVNLEDYDKLKQTPLQCRGLHYDLVMNGVELGGGSTRIHEPVLQNYILKKILNIKNSEELFGHLLNAFKMGTPPHSGFAIGFDRMCAMLCGTNSIRDVISFPKSATGTDMVVGSPSEVSQSALNDYNIKYSETKITMDVQEKPKDQ